MKVMIVMASSAAQTKAIVTARLYLINGTFSTTIALRGARNSPTLWSTSEWCFADGRNSTLLVRKFPLANWGLSADPSSHFCLGAGFANSEP
jgi:hypothetical protein